MPSSSTYSAWWSPMVRAGTGIGRMPRWAAIRSWVARPSSPSEASVPAPPPSMATNTRSSQPCRRSTWRPSSSIHTATLKPKVAGTACWPWVRPGQQHVLGALGQVGQRGQDGRELAQEDLVGAAHLEELAGLGDVLGRRAPVHVAARVALAGAVELPHQRHERVAGARQPLAHRRRDPGRTAAPCARSRGRRRSGMMPSSACARASAASTSSQDWNRAGSVNSARTPGIVDPERGRLFEHGRFCRTPLAPCQPGSAYDRAQPAATEKCRISRPDPGYDPGPWESSTGRWR